MVLDERTFGVRVSVETFLISWTTGPGWWVRGDGSGVWVCVKEKHNTIHCIAREVGELGQRVEDVLLFCW